MRTRGRVFEKSVYSPSSPSDGLRVLVTRYWPRGVKKELAGVWLKGVGPSPGLIRLWKDGGMEWAEFRQRYLDEFSNEERKAAFDELRKLAAESMGPVTLLCACPDGSLCHRQILKDIIEANMSAKRR